MAAVYRVELPISPVDDQGVDVRTSVVSVVDDWLTQRVGLAPVLDEKVSSADGLVGVRHRRQHGTAGQLTRWDAVQAQDGWGWNTTIWMLDDEDGITVHILLEVTSTEDRAVQLDRPLHAPGVVGQLLRSQLVYADGFQVGETLRLTAVDVPALTAFLLDQGRSRPVVVVTPRAGGSHTPSDADEVCRRVGGLAHVVDLSGVEATRALSSELGDLGVFDGGIRIYWPGFTLRSRRGAHPLFLRRRIEQQGRAPINTAIFRMLASASVMVDPVPELERLIHAEAQRIERDRNDARVADLRGQLRERSVLLEGQTVVEDGWFEQLEESMSAVEQLTDERNEALDEIQLLQEEVDRLRSDLVVQRQNWAMVQASAAGNTDRVDEVTTDEDWGGDGETTEPTTVAEAVTIAEQECAHLVFLDKAHSSAAESLYPRPQKVLDDLRALDKVAGRWAAGDATQGIRQACQDAGLTNLRFGVSKTARQRYKADYTRTYDGQEVLLAAHLASGTGAVTEILRIYWYEDSAKHKLVIGHVGRKLRDASNP